jgi:hypothetical protein
VRASPAVLLALTLAACGGASSDAPLAVRVDGATAAYTPAYLLAPTLDADTRATAAAAARLWGAPADATFGWRVVFSQEPFACGPASVDETVGCTEPAAREIWILAYGAACPAATALPHELGHLAIGDAAHRDRRWCDPEFWRSMRAALAAVSPAECDLSDLVERNLSGCPGDGDD